ncbi:MAG: glycosyltransferase [Cyclobacteriaceae bacterium]|nr:glycosyltransferase [Cyclobacteriaceae bacterium]
MIEMKKKFVVMVDKNLPTDHSFIQGLFEKVLPEKSQEIVFVGFQGDLDIDREYITFNFIKPWSDNYVLRKTQKVFSFTYNMFKVNPDVLYTRNDPTYLIIGFFFKIFKKKGVHVHQISHLHAYSKTLRNSFVYRIKASVDLFLRRFLLSYVDLILTISESMNLFLETEWAKHKEKLRVYPLGVLSDDFPIFIPFDERKIDLAYIGTLAKSRELNVIIDAIKLYTVNYSDEIVLNIWGESHEPRDNELLRQYIKDLGLRDNVLMHGKVDRKEILKLLPNVKIGLSTIPAKGLLVQISPTKLMEYLAAGCEIIATKGILDQEKIIKEASVGNLIDFSPNQIANEINNILNVKTKNERFGDIGRTFIFRNRSYEDMGQRLLDDIKSVS